MNRIEPLTDELIQAMFERRAERAAVGSLGEEILAATASTRQRSVLGLRLAGIQPRLASRPAWVALAVLAALLGVLLAVALSSHRQPGPLRTGLLAFVRAGDVYLANPDGSNAEIVLHQNGVVFGTVAWAPTGERLAADGEAGVVVVDAATGASTVIGGTNPVWSPDGTELAVLDPPGTPPGSDGSHLRIVDSGSGATVHSYAFPAISGLAWSLNGNWIAATGGTSGAANALARIDVKTGQWVELDGGSGMLDSAREPAWSPDSLHIAFIRWGATLCQGSPLCATDVYVANADGSNAIRLNRVPGKADLPSWSPDGRWIAYRQVDRAAVDIHGGISDKTTSIVIVRPDGTGERMIGAPGVAAFAWSAASDRLRFVSNTGLGSAESISDATLDGVVKPVDLALGPAPDLFERTGHRFDWQALASERDVPPLPAVPQPAPATVMAVVAPASAAPVDPSATWPALAAVSDNGCQPMTVATATGQTSTIANLCDGSSPLDTWSWSPTGSAFAGVRGGTLVIVGRDGTHATNVGQLSGLNSIDWSPDGTWLTATGAKTWLLHPDGTGLREIPGGGPNSYATWSADGRTLALAVSDGRLLVGSPGGTDLQSIGAFPIPISWSPDASRFAFIRDGNAWTAKRDGTDLHNVLSLALGGVSNVEWSPDGHWLAVGTTHGLWQVRPDGAGSRWLGLGLDESTFGFAWSPSSRKLALPIYTDGRATPQRSYIDLIDTSGAPTVRLDRLTAPSWSPDSRFLVASSSQDDGQATKDLVLMNEDGSGGRALAAPSTLDPFVWLR